MTPLCPLSISRSLSTPLPLSHTWVGPARTDKDAAKQVVCTDELLVDFSTLGMPDDSTEPSQVLLDTVHTDSVDRLPSLLVPHDEVGRRFHRDTATCILPCAFHDDADLRGHQVMHSPSTLSVEHLYEQFLAAVKTTKDGIASAQVCTEQL
jgi:hypothetical protein